VKILKRCRCKVPLVCGFGPTRCLECGKRTNFYLIRAARKYDNENGIIRNNDGVKIN